MLSGLSIHIALAPSTKTPIAKLVTNNGGSVADLHDADVAISRKGSAQVKNIDDAGVPCVSTTWLRQTISKGEPLQYGEFLLGAEGDKGSPKRDREESEDVSPAKKPKREKAPQKKKKKKLQLSLSDDADSLTLLPIIKQLGGTVNEATTSALTNYLSMEALISPLGSKTGEAALAIVSGKSVVSEEWVYASLEAGEWQEFDKYMPLEGCARSCEEDPPFEDKAIFITGRTTLAIGSNGARLIVTRGGGAVADSADTADVVVCMTKTYKGEPPKSAPVVNVGWLLDSAEAYKVQPFKTYLLVEGSESPESSPEKVEKEVKRKPKPKAKAKAKATAKEEKREEKDKGKKKPKNDKAKQVAAEQESSEESEKDAASKSSEAEAEAEAVPEPVAEPEPVPEPEPVAEPVPEPGVEAGDANEREPSPAPSSGSLVIDDSDIVV